MRNIYNLLFWRDLSEIILQNITSHIIFEILTIKDKNQPFTLQLFF
jgi:hypothetical protein